MKSLEPVLFGTWDCDTIRSNVGARLKITDDNLSLLIDSLSLNDQDFDVEIFTGIHGDTNGHPQVDESEFADIDADEYHDPDQGIKVFQLRGTNLFESKRLFKSLKNNNVITVLAWCWSWFFLESIDLDNFDLDEEPTITSDFFDENPYAILADLDD
jgi:hypothetical protein